MEEEEEEGDLDQHAPQLIIHPQKVFFVGDNTSDGAVESSLGFLLERGY